MQLYQVVWFIIFCYMGIKGVQSIMGTGTFFGGAGHLSSDSMDQPKHMYGDNKLTQTKGKNSYLVLIGSDNDKYCFLYQPETVVLSYGGSKRSIFEQTLLGLKLDAVITVVYSDAMVARIQADIKNRKQDNRWMVFLSSNIRKGDYINEVRKVDASIQLASNHTLSYPSTIVFDIGDYNAEYLKTLIKYYKQTCVQYIIYNKKRILSNLKSIIMMMDRSGYRHVKRAKSQYIATFVVKSSPLWK